MPSGEPVQPPKPAAEPAPDTKVAALERSVGDDKASIENFLRRDYLTPDTRTMSETVKRIYGSSATIFGTRYDADAIVKVKSDWFAQWASWSLGLEPGSLEITPHGEDRAEAAFAMRYDYVPKDKSAARLTGKARVTLGLVKAEDGWRIESETSQAMQ